VLRETVRGLPWALQRRCVVPKQAAAMVRLAMQPAGRLH